MVTRMKSDTDLLKKKNVKSEEKYIYLTLNEMCQKVNFDDCNTVWKVREKKCNWKKVKPWPNIKYNTWWIVTKDKSENKWNVKKKQQLRETLNLLARSTDTKNGHHGTWLIEWIGQAADSVKSKCDKKRKCAKRGNVTTDEVWQNINMKKITCDQR